MLDRILNFFKPKPEANYNWTPMADAVVDLEVIPPHANHLRSTGDALKGEDRPAKVIPRGSQSNMTVSEWRVQQLPDELLFR